MSANLSGNNIDNGDFMIKTCAADPEAGYAKEKFHADPKNGVIISEVDGPKGKRLEFSADWSVVSLDTKLKEGDNIKISEDQQTGKVEISAPDVGKVKQNGEFYDVIAGDGIDIDHGRFSVNRALVKDVVVYEYHGKQTEDSDGYYQFDESNAFAVLMPKMTCAQNYGVEDDVYTIGFNTIIGKDNFISDGNSKFIIRLYIAIDHAAEYSTNNVKLYYYCPTYLLPDIGGGELFEDVIEINFTTENTDSYYTTIDINIDPENIFTASNQWRLVSFTMSRYGGQDASERDMRVFILGAQIIQQDYNINSHNIGE